MENKKEVEVSIIICCYNSDLQKLKNTIISSYKQKNISSEIIISDDGSVDNHKKEIEEFVKSIGAKNIKYNFLERNVGTVKNILSAVNISTGKIIKTISPGDYFYDAYSLEKSVCAMKEQRVNIVYGDAVFYNRDEIVSKENISHNKIIYSPKHIKNEFCLYGGYFMGMAFIAEKEIYIKYLTPFSDKVKYMEDRALLYSCFIDNVRVYGIPQHLYWYEYGYGISTQSHNTLLDIDEENIFPVLKDIYLDSKYLRKMIKIYKIKKKNKICKLFYYIFCFPSFFTHRILRKKYGYIINNSSMEDLYDIITLEKSEK